MPSLKELFLECECFTHGIKVSVNEDWLNNNEIGISFSFWYRGQYGTSFWERIKAAWAVLRGSRYMFDAIILKKEKVQELNELLEKALTGKYTKEADPNEAK